MDVLFNDYYEEIRKMTISLNDAKGLYKDAISRIIYNNTDLDKGNKFEKVINCNLDYVTKKQETKEKNLDNDQKMNKVERELSATFIENHDTEYILQNYDEVAQYLTTPELKSDFLAVVQALDQDLTQQPEEQSFNTEINLPDGYEINQYGEIILNSVSTSKIKNHEDIYM